ncbi:uncharacterized protein LOC121521015 isoform X1 [Cheilinus undulatus]|uniref:uncharacterized protein LOC121521015 isoform X1 n=1 Tax=Cheilinus undulatus TaxID=241271 RepID=UPI001BD3FB8D|nr:uncharacterized protein LOC121521015 isoform X1 [Cheilinus undulatus]
MAGHFASGSLLLVLLIGSGYAFPSKKVSAFLGGYSPGSSVASSGVASAPAVSNWEAPSSGGYVPSASYSGAVASSAPVEAAPDTGYVFAQPVGQPATSYSSSSAAPVHPGYMSSGASFQPAAMQDIAWMVEPPTFLAVQTPAQLAASSGSSSNVNAPVRQGGEMSSYERSVEHGNAESETEAHGSQPAPSVEAEVSTDESTSEVQPEVVRRRFPVLPYPYDFMFLTGQYPAGVITHSSQAYEQGADHWQDAHYVRYHLPAFTFIKEQPQMAPSVKNVKQPVKQQVKGGY